MSRPVSSPCAPAAGWSVIASMPVISVRHSLSVFIMRNALRLVRMPVGQAIKPGDYFVHPWVVLHGAGAQRIHTEINGVVPGRKAREVTDDFDLAYLGHVAQVLSF